MLRIRKLLGLKSDADESGRPGTPLWVLVLMAPFTLIGLLLRPIELVIRLVFIPVEMLLPRSLRGDHGILGTVKTIIYALLIALFIRTLAYEPFNIPSGSMKPTLLAGDYLFVSKFSYGYGNYSLGFGTDMGIFGERLFGAQPERGDVVVFRKPTDTSVDFIKRVVGLPGDSIQMIGGILHVNGVAVPQEETEPFIDRRCKTHRAIDRYIETLPGGKQHEVLHISENSRYDDTAVVEVPDRHYFMMGDNRDSSNDSRVANIVGFVPEANLIGRAAFLFFSSDGCGSLLAPWTWPVSIRWSRIFQSVE